MSGPFRTEQFLESACVCEGFQEGALWHISRHVEYTEFHRYCILSKVANRQWREYLDSIIKSVDRCLAIITQPQQSRVFPASFIQVSNTYIYFNKCPVSEHLLNTTLWSAIHSHESIFDFRRCAGLSFRWRRKPTCSNPKLSEARKDSPFDSKMSW